MEIKYELHKIKNAQGTGKSRVFVQLRNKKALTTEDLFREIQDSCTLKVSDVKAVMTEIRDIAIRELSKGKRFYLPEIGYLSLSVSNTPLSRKPNGTITGKDICLRNINFHPEKKMLTELRRKVSFIKSGDSSVSVQYGEEELWGKMKAYLSTHRDITREAMRSEFGLSEYKAKQWAEHFVESGRLKKEGSRHIIYFL